MCTSVPQRARWIRHSAWLGLGGVLFLSGYVTALWAPLPPAAWSTTAQAAEAQAGRSHSHQHDQKQPPAPVQHAPREAEASKESKGDLAPFMIRNAYHFATLYHAARAERWELAAYQVGELEENLADAVKEAGSYAPFLKDFLKEHVEPLQQAITAHNSDQFRTVFQAAVEGCNDCHRATNHGFITIPEEPPSLSIFVLPPAGR